MRWYSAELEAAFPDTFHIGVDPSQPLQLWPLEMNLVDSLILKPCLAYFVLWAVPYFLVIFYFRADRIRDLGYVTMYAVQEQVLERYLNSFRISLRPVVYMCIHALLSYLAICITPFLWSSYWLNTIYLLAILLISIWNASTYYFRVLPLKYFRAGEEAGYKELESLLQHRDEAAVPTVETTVLSEEKKKNN